MASSILFRIAGQLVPPQDRDGDCLRRFVDTRDEAAFAELVHRHGSAVYGICRRAIGDHQLAEDSFQAVFVILARKAGTIRTPDAVGGWLFGVARHVAARAVAMRRRTRKEQSTDQLPERATEIVEPADDSAILESEIAKLPEGQRVAVVLCEIEGLTRAQAATRLGIAEGTLSSRLANARKQLALRLRERGIAPALAFGALTAVPPALSAATIASATHSTATLAPVVAKLTRETLHMMFLSKLKLAAVAIVCALSLWGGFGNWQSTETIAAPVPKAELDAGIIWTYNPSTGDLIGYAPDGKKVKELKLKDEILLLALTPDGQQLLYAAKDGKLPKDPWKPGEGLTLHLRPLGETTDGGTDLGFPFDLQDTLQRFTFSSDGKRLIHTRRQTSAAVNRIESTYTHSVFDLTARTKTDLKGPADAAILDVSADGTWALAVDRKSHEFFGGPGLPAQQIPKQQLYKVPLDGKEMTTLAEWQSIETAAIAPDGKSLLFSGTPKESENGVATQAYQSVFRFDLETGKTVEIIRHDTQGSTVIGWARDGKRFAYLWWDCELDEAQKAFLPKTTRLAICDANGKPDKTWEIHAHKDGRANGPRLLGWFPSKPKADVSDPRKRNAPVPKDKPREVIAFFQQSVGDLRLFDVANGTESTIPKLLFSEVRLSPTGKHVAYFRDFSKRGESGLPLQSVFVRAIDDEEPGTDLEVTGKSFAWSPDGLEIAVTERDSRKLTGAVCEHVIVNIATKKITPLDLPKNQTIRDWSPDGKHFLTERNHTPDGELAANRLYLFTREGVEVKALTPGNSNFGMGGRFSPDGKSVISLGGRDVKDTNKSTGGTALYRIPAIWNVATGKQMQLINTPKNADVESVCWSPDGKRIAYSWKAIPTGTIEQQGNAETESSLTVCDLDGSNAKTIATAKADGAFHVIFGSIDWREMKIREAKPDPRKRNAPVPKTEKEDLKLTPTTSPEKVEIMLGEPTSVTFKVANPSDKNWRLLIGGDYRNLLGRPESFAVKVVGPDGKAVPQPDSGMSMGGESSPSPLPAKGEHAFSLFLPHWATFEKPGEYKLTIIRKLELVPDDESDPFRAIPTHVEVSATTKITVIAPDAAKFGTLIADLGKTMLDMESPDCERAQKRLVEIHDVRVIPHFIKLAARPAPEPRMTAGDVLSRFDTDEAFAALKKLADTTAADLRGSATTVELEESSAAGVRHSAVHKIGKCPHPDALPLFWSHADDEYYGTRLSVLHRAAEVKSVKARRIIEKMTTDTNETVRNEAIRYRNKLMKEDD